MTKSTKTEMTRVKSAGVNLSGRDNRTPFVGMTQFPTEGSKAVAQKFDSAAKGAAEVGPAPLTPKLDRTNIVPLKEIIPSMPTAKGSLPIVKKASRYDSDPLVQYLRKHAQQLESNVDSFVRVVYAAPLQSRDSDFIGTPAKKKMEEQDELLDKLFDNYDRSVVGL